MNKPSWNDSPNWANYVARDSDGEWYWYANQPSPETYTWNPEGGRFKSANLVDCWQDSLEERPK